MLTKIKEKSSIYIEKLKPFIFILPSVLFAAFSAGGIYIGSNIAAKNRLADNNVQNSTSVESNIQNDISGDTKNKLMNSDKKTANTVSANVKKIKKTKLKKGKPADGVFEGNSVCEKFGYTVSLKAKFKAGKPIAVYGMKMLDNNDTSNNAYMQKAWHGMVKKLLGNKAAKASDMSGIDGVSGATYSSNAIINAYLDAYNKAVAKADGTKVKATPKPEIAKKQKSDKKPIAVKVPKPAKIPESAVADGKYRVSAVCEPDEDEDFQKYTLSATFTFSKGRCTDISEFSSTAEGNKSYYMKAANGSGDTKGITAQLLKNQSSDGISAVSGATCSSKTIVELYIKALEKAAKKAGINKTPMPTRQPQNTAAPTKQPQATVSPLPSDEAAPVSPSASPEPQPSLVPLNPGTYKETVTVYPDESYDFEEYTLTADVVFADNRFCGFENVELSDESNRFYYNKAANGTKTKPGLISQINAKQNDELDAVSGATCTSDALIELFSKAWNEAKIK